MRKWNLWSSAAGAVDTDKFLCALPIADFSLPVHFFDLAQLIAGETGTENHEEIAEQI